jgi:hypothetical protein
MVGYSDFMFLISRYQLNLINEERGRLDMEYASSHQSMHYLSQEKGKEYTPIFDASANPSR